MIASRGRYLGGDKLPASETIRGVRGADRAPLGHQLRQAKARRPPHRLPHVLEHRRRPRAAAEARPDVMLAVTSFGATPACPAVSEVMRRLNQAQVRGGGDPFVGQRLETFFGGAGFARVVVDRPPLRGDSGDPPFFQAFIDEFAEIFEGLDESLGVEALPLIAVGHQGAEGAARGGGGIAALHAGDRAGVEVS